METYVQKAKRLLKAELGRKYYCPDGLLDLYVLLVLSKGNLTSMRDVHDAWATFTNADWPEHKNIVGFSDLTDETKMLSAPYRKAIGRAALRMGRS